MIETATMAASLVQPGRPATQGGGSRWKAFHIILFPMNSFTFIVYRTYSLFARNYSLLRMRRRIDIIGARHVFCPSPRLGLSGIPGLRNGYGLLNIKRCLTSASRLLSFNIHHLLCCLVIDTFAALVAIDNLLSVFEN